MKQEKCKNRLKYTINLSRIKTNLCYTDSNGTDQLNIVNIFKALINSENQISSIDLERVVFNDKIFNETNESLIQELLKSFTEPFVNAFTSHKAIRCFIFKYLLSPIDEFQFDLKNGIQTPNINLPQFKFNSRGKEIIFTMKEASIIEPIPINPLINTFKHFQENIPNIMKQSFKFFFNLANISINFKLSKSINDQYTFALTSDLLTFEYDPLSSSKFIKKCITKIMLEVVEKQQQNKRLLVNRALIKVKINPVDAEFTINLAINSKVDLSFHLIFPLISKIEFHLESGWYFPAIIGYCKANDVVNLAFEMNRCILCINSLENIKISCERLTLMSSNFETHQDHLNQIKSLACFKFQFNSFETFYFHFSEVFADSTCLLLKLKNLNFDCETKFDNEQNLWREDLKVTYGSESCKKFKNADKLSSLALVKGFPVLQSSKFNIETWSNQLADQIKKINNSELIVSLPNAKFELNLFSEATSNNIKFNFKVINVASQDRQLFLINQSVFKRVYNDLVSNHSKSFVNKLFSNYEKLATDRDFNKQNTNLCLFADLNGKLISEEDLKYVDRSKLACIAHRYSLLAISDFFRLINHVKL